MQRRSGKRYRHNKALCKSIVQSNGQVKKRRSKTRPLILPLKDYDNYRLSITNDKESKQTNMATNRNFRP